MRWKPILPETSQEALTIESWTLPAGTGAHVVKWYGEGEKRYSYQDYTPELITINLLILNSGGIWQQVKTVTHNKNASGLWPYPELTEVKNLYHAAAIIGRMFGSPVRLYRADTGEAIGQTENFPAMGVVKVSGVKYSGQDNDYNCTTKDGRTYLVPFRYIYWAKPGSRAMVSYDWFKHEWDAQQDSKDGYKRREMLRQELRIGGEPYPLDEPFTIEGWTYRYNATTQHPFSLRWELRYKDGEWDHPSSAEFDMLDELCGQPRRSYEEWKQIEADLKAKGK